MTSITGPAETWLIEAHNSFASIEALDKALHPFLSEMPSVGQPDQLPGDVLAASRSLIALYRPAWSYRPDQAIRLFPKARYFLVSIYLVRPGAEADFFESVRLRKGNLDSVNLDRPEIAYQVISGAPAGTYLFLAPLTSLKTLDEGLARTSTYVESNPPGAKAGNGAQGEISRGRLLFRMEPGMSYVSDDFASDALEFWRPKPKAQ